MGFSELGLSPELLRAVSDAGYTIPTPIQLQAIPHVQRGRDVLGCAQTGTGKTASFVLPMIDMLAAGRARVRMPRSLILEPTRELATQVAASFELYGKHHRLAMALLIGGESFVDQERKLDRGVDVLIATPGRLLDLYGRGKILLSDARILVIDESDRMLDMGFIPDVERIVGLLPEPRQTLLFSATMPPEIRRLADAFLRTPVEIAVAPPASPSATVVQSLAVVQPEDKREALRRLIGAEDYIHRIGRTARAGRLGRSLMLAVPEDGRAVAAIVKLIGRDIPMVVVPGIAEAKLEYDERRRRGSRGAARSERRPHAGNGDARARVAAEHRAPRRDRRSAAPQAPSATGNGSNVTPFPRAAEVRKTGQQERQREEKRVVGFGDDLPAFLARPSRSVARP